MLIFYSDSDYQRKFDRRSITFVGALGLSNRKASIDWKSRISNWARAWIAFYFEFWWFVEISEDFSIFEPQEVQNANKNFLGIEYS